jgi:hypothetical protein
MSPSPSFLLLAAVPLLWHPLPLAGSHCGVGRVRGSTESEIPPPPIHPGNADLRSKGALNIACDGLNSFKVRPVLLDHKYLHSNKMERVSNIMRIDQENLLLAYISYFEEL